MHYSCKLYIYDSYTYIVDWHTPFFSEKACQVVPYSRMHLDKEKEAEIVCFCLPTHIPFDYRILLGKSASYSRVCYATMFPCVYLAHLNFTISHYLILL